MKSSFSTVLSGSISIVALFYLLNEKESSLVCFTIFGLALPVDFASDVEQLIPAGVTS